MKTKTSHLAQARDEIKRLMIDATYSGRGHQQVGQMWMSVYYCLNLPATILSAALGVGAAGSALLGKDSVITASLAIVSVVIVSMKDFLKADKQADAHLIKGSMYISIRNRARILREVEVYNLSIEESTLKLSELRSEYDLLGLKSPTNVYKWAYNKAKQSIKKGESDYENDPLWKTLG